MSSTKALLLGIAAALAAIAGLVAAQYMLVPKTIEMASGTLLQKPRPIADFQLADTSGAPFDKARLQGHWSLVFTGFTYCPDVCPTTMGLIKTLKSRLDAQQRPLQVVFVSIDPERDTPEQLQRYVAYFDPGFVGVTGPNEQLDKLMASLSLVYAKVPGDSPQTYTMDHSAALVLVNPQGEVAGYFLPPLKPDALAADLERVLPVAAS